MDVDADAGEVSAGEPRRGAPQRRAWHNSVPGVSVSACCHGVCEGEYEARRSGIASAATAVMTMRRFGARGKEDGGLGGYGCDHGEDETDHEGTAAITARTRPISIIWAVIPVRAVVSRGDGAATP